MDSCKIEGCSSTCCSDLQLSSSETDNKKSNGGEDAEYPLNTKPLENQVAGHDFKDGKYTFGLLKHSDGYILKPVNRPIQGEKEIKFYEDMKKTTEPLLLEFKQFIPEYYGTTVLHLKGKKVTFLLLKDITNGFEEPCIMDIKVGKQTWEPGAPIEKQQSEQRKYVECKQTLHFCIPGFQVYDIKTGKFQRYGKDYGKTLNAVGVFDALRLFFNLDHGMSEIVIIQMLSQLNKILNWWKKQNLIHIYSSSILLAYDASVLREKIFSKRNIEIDNSFQNHINCLCSSVSENASKDFNSESKSWQCMYLIDFAHVIHAEENSPDLNYISGLTSIINVFEKLLSDTRLNKSCENSLQES